MSVFWKRVLTAIVILLFLWLLYSIRFLVYYFFIAAAISLMARPINNFLSELKIGKYRIPSSVIALFILFFILGLAVGFFMIVVPPLNAELSALLNIDYQQLLNEGSDSYLVVKNWLADRNILVENYITAEGLKELANNLFSSLSIGGTLGGLLGAFGAFFVTLLSVLFISFFLIKDRELLDDILFAVVPDKHAEKAKTILENSKKMLTRYFIGLLIQVILVSVLISIALLFLGVKYALLLGVMAGFLNLIPYVGPIIALTLAMLINFFLNLNMPFYAELLPLLGKVTVVFLVVQALDNMVLQPVIFSNSVQAHPLEIFFVITIAGTLAGVLGMILAIPMYTFLRIIAKEFLSQNKIVQGLTKRI
jgi:predicted PurR-regulated permease PerM